MTAPPEAPGPPRAGGPGAEGPPRALLGWILLVLLCAPIVLYRLGGPALGDPDEGRNAEVAREMLVTGDFITPRINDARYLDKPPAYFWVVAASLRAIGVNELGARLPSALFALIGIALTAWFARRHWGPRTGWPAGAILALTPLYIVFARTVIFDMMLTVCMTLSVMAAFEAMEGSRVAGPIAFAAAGLGTITKGPVALVVPLLVAATWAVLERRPGLLRRLRPGAGMAIYAAIVLPWLVLVSARNPGFLEYAIVGENLKRIATDTFETSRPFYFYPTVVLPGLFPWILYAGASAARRGLRGLRAGRAVPGAAPRDPRARAERFAVVWIGVVYLFFSLVSSKRPSYMLPLAVPVALLAGGLWGRLFGRGGAVVGGAPDDRSTDDVERAEARRDLTIGSVAVAVSCLLLAAALALAGPAGLARGIEEGKYDPLLTRDLLFGLTAAGLVAVAFFALIARRARRPGLVFVSAALTIAVMVPMARAVMGYVGAARSSRTVSRFLAARLGPDDRVICFEEYRPGINFYLKRPIYLVSGPGRTFTSNYIQMHIEEYRNDPTFRMIPKDRLTEALLQDGTTFIVAPVRSYDALRAAAGVPLRTIYEDGVGAIFVRSAADR